MMPKPSKIIKKGFDPPGNNYIALGSRSKDSTTPNTNSNPAPTSTATVIQSSELSAPSLKQSNSSSNLLSNNSNGNNQTLETNSNSTKTAKLTSNNSSSNLTSLANSNNNGINSNNNTNSSSNNNSNPYYIDSKTVKDEILKALEKEDSNEKLIKLIKSLIINLRNCTNGLTNKSQVPQQQPQPDLNFLMALSYVSLKRPQLFIKQTSLVDFLCTNLLFTSKNPINDKSATTGVLKSKSLQSVRAPTSPQTQNLTSIQPLICNILSFIFENENTWPEIFVKAYVDDSLGERSWVDSALCKEFVDNIKTAFSTKPIPFSVENTPMSNLINNNSNSNSSSDLQSIKANTDDQLLELSGGIFDFSGKKFQILPRYSSINSEIEILLVDLIRNFMAMNNKGQPVKRLLGQTITSLGSSSAIVNPIDSKNFLKLLQNTCGFGEIRAIALSKLESWLLNPKLDTSAQDLLLAICVNCVQNDQTDKDIIAQIIKIKPKLKQQQHYSDCIRELIKSNQNNLETLIQLTVRNEMHLQQSNMQQQQQAQQQQQIVTSKNQHNLMLIQIAFSTDGANSSKFLAQTMLKIILQKSGEDYLRSLRILLRDNIRNCRQDFDLIKFTNELISDSLIKQYFYKPDSSTSGCSLFSLAGGLADFGLNQIRERYVNSICDLITVLILVSITPQIKEAYLRRTIETKDILIKYYVTMSQVQSDTVTWLQSIFKLYDINPTELIKCLFKILFMVEKPEQCYTIDNWPSEQERATLFRVVSEIPVLSETLHQVLMITQHLPEHLHMLMLCVEENLLKIAALVHIKDVYNLKLNKIDQFVESLFNICLYKYQNPPSLVVTILYWRAWQILLLMSALDPKGFGKAAWDKYPTLRILMEMIMIEDYNYPPQSSITEDLSIEKFRAIENQACSLEKQEILEFESMFEMKQGLAVKTESNSKLIGQVMKFDPTGPPRRPSIDIIQNIRKLNSEYKLGQLLCKNRQPDFLLILIKRQNTKLSLPWISSLIESNSDCLEVMPIQCICEFVWNLLSGTEEEITLKKQLNIEQLINRIKAILTTEDLSDSIIIQQITETFDFFLNKLCSEKQAIRNGALKIFNKLFLSSSCILDRIQIPPLPGQQTLQSQQTVQIDFEQLLNSFKHLASYDICLKPLLIKYFRKAIMVETNSSYLNIYLYFLFKQLLKDYKQQNELESSLKMELDESESLNNGNFQIFIKNESLKQTYNEIGLDFAEFFFKRDYYLSCVKLLNFDHYQELNEPTELNTSNDLKSFLIDFSVLLFKLNELNPDQDYELIKHKNEFNRSSLDSNSFILIENKHLSTFYYLNEKIFNLIVYFLILIIKIDKKLFKNLNENNSNSIKNLCSIILGLNCLNCKFYESLNNLVKDKLLKLNPVVNSLKEYFNKSDKPECVMGFRLIEFLLNSLETEFEPMLQILVSKYGLSFLTIYLIIKKLESINIDVNKLDQFCTSNSISIKKLINIVRTYVNSVKKSIENEPEMSQFMVGDKILKFLVKADEQFSITDVDMVEQHDENKLFVFSKFKNPVETNFNELDKMENNFLSKIKSQINSIRSETRSKFESLKVEDLNEEMSEEQEEEKVEAQLVNLINESTNQNLEFNLNKKLNDLDHESRILSISESILIYEKKKKECLKRSRSSCSKIINKTESNNVRDKITYKRCVIDLLLDYLCHFDPQIVNKQFEIEFRLLFELRNLNLSKKETYYESSSSGLTQSFLLSLFLHQANWQKIYDCVQYILKNHQFFKKHAQKFSLNPTIILDFLSSIIHIPELWKGTESKIIKKTEEENVLNLKEEQICIIIDYIIEEMFILHEQTKSIEIEVFNLTNRIELLKNTFKNKKIKKENLFKIILKHLQSQKTHLNKLSPNDETNNFYLNTILFNNSQARYLLDKIQTILLYKIYLEETSIIYQITNSNRLFSNFYSYIDKPTELDLKAHNLLNCFGEIEVNLSNNLTSSGIIGVAVTASKRENQELVQYSKKQEAFMVDANFVCVKLASSHPFIFIRQLPMMEGLLQGRVGYSFEEFKRRKFDKLFHYIIDLLNILVPYVFHVKYLDLIELIISHYFDVFMSYCADNREFIGGLVIKFAEFLEKFINCDIKLGYLVVIKKYSQFISVLQKSYPDIGSLKYLNSLQSIPFDSIETYKQMSKGDLLSQTPHTLKCVNNLNQKLKMPIWTSKQLEPFINKLTNRNNYENVLSVLQELDAVSQRQPIMLSHFIIYLEPLIQDSNDLIRDLAISLLMRHLRLNPKETSSFYQSYLECLNSNNSKVFNSAVKYLPDFNLLCSENSSNVLKTALKGSARHNTDISKQLSDSIRLLQLEKYVY